tara:strand:- start:602 stop:826 length:225 start_codon:yes stop_codon:yes gene_type:complete
MNRYKDVAMLILAVGLMTLLGLITVGEFIAAMSTESELDPNVVELLQMSITGIVGLLAGYISGRNTSQECSCKK